MVGPTILSSLNDMASDSLPNAERIWTAKFLVSAESTREGLSVNKWLFALELASPSTPAWVDADLLVRGRSNQATTSTSDSNEPVFSIPIGCVGRPLQPGPDNAIKVRLDDGPMRLHWINEFVNIPFIVHLRHLIDSSFYSSLTLLDAEGTLHAEIHVRLSQPVPTLSPDNSDALSATHTTHTTSSNSEGARSPTRRNRAKSKPKVEIPDKPVYASLRKGGGRLR